MSFIERQQKPILILDVDRCKRNIYRMTERAKAADCEFRPHFKTHQSKQIGRWFREFGVTGITVSSFAMANYFIEDGWNDITIAFPFFSQQLESLKMIEKNASIRLFVNSVKDLKVLNRELTKPFKFFIEIDSGSGRSGIFYKNIKLISELIEASENLNNSVFHGFYIHDGRTYRSRYKKEIQEIINPTIDILVGLKSKFPQSKISLGDTPSASTSERISVLDEMTPGNFVFYDYMQTQIGSCSLNDVALFAVLPIAQKIIKDKRTILHGGAVHLSKDFIFSGHEKNFGQIVHYSNSSDIIQAEEFISAISQEHGTIQGIPNSDKQVWVCPVHSCLTANLYSEYFTVNGEVIEKRILS